MDQPAIVSEVMAALNRVLPSQRPIALHEPKFGGNEWQYVKNCLDTGWVSSSGSHVSRFEQLLQDFTGAPYAVAVVNGTAALHIALQLAGVRPGDEVITPALSFVATANAISYCGGIPHFMDSESATLGANPVALAEYLSDIARVSSGVCFNRITGRPLRAVIPMHTFGHPVAIDGFLELCNRFGLALVEDAAESLGSYYGNRHTGTFGLLGTLSFNGNKIITTGGGGAILTNDKGLAQQAKHLTTTAKTNHRWTFSHDQLGYNYRLPNINAALGCAQLEQISGFLAAKRRLAARYHEAFSSVSDATLFSEPPGCRSNYWLNTLLLDQPSESLLDTLLETTNEEGILTRPAWTLMHHLPMYATCPKMHLPVAEDLAKRLLNLPSSVLLESIDG